MNKSETHVVTGMSRDLTVTRFNPNLVVDARNIRITSKDGNSTLLAVTNEKGTKEVELSQRMYGTILGSAVINDTLIVFSKYDEETCDLIYKVTFPDNSPAQVEEFFRGTLNFDLEHPIECTVVYENENIQKVYWVDGLNQPRMINICKEYEDDDNDAFNFCQNVEFTHTFTVEKFSSGGEFPVGTIQYCFSYFNLNGQETNLIECSPLYYLSPVDRGLPADGKCNNSFKITIENADSSFEYIRLYSIVRTSENATPNCKIVGDFKVSQDKLVFVDTGTVGSTIDPTALYFIGGKNFVAGTLAQKDNTLFLGEITNNSAYIGNIEFEQINLQQYIRDNIGSENPVIPVESVYFDHTSTPKTSDEPITGEEYWETAEVAGREFYSDPVNNSESSRKKKGFKSHEGYRLGFIAQKNTGEWSDVIWIGDYDEECMPGEHFFKWGEMPDHSDTRALWRSCKRTLGFRASIPSSIASALKNKGFENIAPVVVFPQDVDRKVMCQGILFGTVYNINDRLDNSPFAQADWRARLDYTFNSIDNEIQTSPIAVNPLTPELDNITDYNTKVQNFKDLYGGFYYRDANIIDFYSPDIEMSEIDISPYIENAKLRIVGFSNLGYWNGGGKPYIPEKVIDSYLDIQTRGLLDTSTSRYPSIFKELKLGSSTTGNYSRYQINSRGTIIPQDLCFPGLLDTYINLDGTIGGIPETSSGSTNYLYLTYLWHRNGSLNNQNPSSNSETVRSALYNRKCISEIQYGLTTYLQPADTNIDLPPYSIDINTPKVFDSDKISALKIPIDDVNGNIEEVLYYGNVDRVLTPFLKTYETVIDEQTVTLDFSDGYPITYIDIPSYNNANESGGVIQYENGKTIQLNWPNTTTPVHVDYMNAAGQFAMTGKDPVRIKYKSTKHAVFSLKGDTNGGTALSISGSSAPMIWQSIGFRGFTNLKGIDTWFNSSDMDSEVFPFTHLRDSVLIGELYREFSQEELNSRFGGNSNEALANNKWIMCGEAVPIDTTENTILLYKEGDTYIGRYDCLKTYPFTQEDHDSIVSIYSTELESRVNLDLKYDKNRGLQDNTLVTPQNFNLFNRSGYDQTNQFFTYQSLNSDRYTTDYFPNMVTWSLEKSFGEDVDTWTSIPLTSTHTLDGDKGRVTKLITWTDNIFAFQERGFAQLLYNSRVQIPVSDGQPIEITNNMKMAGKRYISQNIGCYNKWSVCATPLGIYFIDDINKGLYVFNGQLGNLSQSKGFDTWMDEHATLAVWNPEFWSNIKTYYEAVNKDLYFMNATESLVFSEKLNNFISFMDYDELDALHNIGDKVIALNSSDWENIAAWQLWAGNYNSFFGEVKPYWLTFISNTDPTVDKIYNTLDWRSTTYTNTDGVFGTLKPLDTFDTIRVWNDYQDTLQTSLELKAGASSNLKKKFNVFRAQIPRDKRAELTGSQRDRIRSPWAYVQLAKVKPNYDLMVFNDLTVNFFE